MERNEALKLVKNELTDKRYVHTLGVAEAALELAARFGAEKEKAELAAIFHDYAKFRPKSEMKQIIIEENLDAELLNYHHELWHAPVGAFLAQQEAGIDDDEILSAIRWHTTGRSEMTLLEKIVFLADYIEPGRSFPGVDEVRELALSNLDEAVLKALRNTMMFLLEKDQPIYPDTLQAYNSLRFMKK